MPVVYELSATNVEIARGLFAGATFDRVFIDSFFEGRQPGRLFVDDPVRPASALLCRVYDYFLAGEPQADLRRFIRDAPSEPGVFQVLRDHGVSEEIPTTALYGFVAVTKAWEDALIADHQG